MLEPIWIPDDATPDKFNCGVVVREVGPGSRPMKAACARKLRNQCEDRWQPFFLETTDFDDAEMIEELRRMEEEGRAYRVQMSCTS